MNNIKFIAKNQYGWEVCDKPFPASEAIPDWWKALPAYTPSEENPNGTKMIIESGHSNAGAKKCIPMLDAITSGYIIPLWADVQARQENGSTKLSWRVSNDVFQVHGVYSSIYKYMEDSHSSGILCTNNSTFWLQKYTISSYTSYN
jgi:hypothetical protein